MTMKKVNANGLNCRQLYDHIFKTCICDIHTHLYIHFGNCTMCRFCIKSQKHFVKWRGWWDFENIKEEGYGMTRGGEWANRRGEWVFLLDYCTVIWNNSVFVAIIAYHTIPQIILHRDDTKSLACPQLVANIQTSIRIQYSLLWVTFLILMEKRTIENI